MQHDIPSIGDDLHVTSIFGSFNGETNAQRQGSFCVFVRLAGCSVRCPWCDTKETWKHGSGRPMNSFEVLTYIQSNYPNYHNVTITGGEPMEQFGPMFIRLVTNLIHAGFKVSIEMAGVQSFVNQVSELREVGWDGDISFVVDFKLPSAALGIDLTTLISNGYTTLTELDTVKFVVDDWADLEVAHAVATLIRAHYLESMNIIHAPVIAVGSTYANFTKQEFLETLLGSDGKYVEVFDVFNLQIHKEVFENVKGVEDEQFTPDGSV